MVMERFPKIPMERTCRLEFEMRNQARFSYKQRLIDERDSKRDVLVEDGTAS